MDKRSLIFVIGLTIALFFVNQWFSKDNKPTTQAPVTKTFEVQPAAPSSSLQNQKSVKEQYFVLENEHQQLVFSNVGGALAEINLPLNDKSHPSSPVRAIEFDRTMAKEFPFNDHFPAFPYQIVKDASVQNVAEGTLGGYYPLLRRSIKGQNDSVIYNTPSRLYALNIVADDGSLDGQTYQVSRLEKDLIEFELVQPQRRIVKTFSFAKDPQKAPYCIDMTVRMEGDVRNLWITSGVPEVELISGSSTPLLKYRPTNINNKKIQVEHLSLPKESTLFNSFYVDWVCNSNGFLGLIVDPITETGPGFRTSMISGILDPTRITQIDSHYQLYPADKYPGYEIQIPLLAKPTQFRIYAGPFEDDILAMVDATYTDPLTGYNPGYTAALNFQGWFTFISEPFAKFLFILMKFFYQITSSWGISIILLTIALRIMLYPLNAWSIKSTLKMKEVAPNVAIIQEKYKKDPKRAQMEVMNLYREKGVNPLTGCFPLLIQLPFLIGMFDLLKSVFELRGVSFIPGWIDNLTSPDVLFGWNYPVLFFGTDFHLLPFLLGGVMWVQQRISAQGPKDPKMMTDQQKQQKMMGNVMTIVFTVMFYHFPSGLNIYWLSSMALGILQQWGTNRKMVNASKELTIRN